MNPLVSEEFPRPKVYVGRLMRKLGEPLATEVKKERQRRWKMQPPYHYWKVRGDAEAPPEEHWCNWCVGWFGVPHEYMHQEPCRESWRGLRMCACIECVVNEQIRRSA